MTYFSHAKNTPRGLRFVVLSLFLLYLSGFFGIDGYADSEYQHLVSETLRLARLGDSQAQFSLGTMYDEGNLLPHDQQKAFYWLAKAAEQNLPAACLYLGMKYEFGNGVEQEKKIAEKWYKQAAVQGWAMAQYLLAMLYLDEEQLSEKLLLAAAWLQLASEQEYPNAKEKLQEIRHTLTDNEKIQLSIICRQLRERTAKASTLFPLQ